MPKSKLTPKENYLRLARGEMPEYVPIHTMGFEGYNGETCYKIVGPSLFNETHLHPVPEGVYYDCWGVKYVANEETNFALIPEPNNYLIKDITKWHEYVKAPKMPDSIDWEQMAKKDYEAANIDTTQSAAMAVIGLMPFQQYVAFMGFENALIAMYEEPESVKELLNFMADVYEPIVKATVEYYKPDMIYLLDDTAAKNHPFISLEVYREFLKPIYQRLTKPAVERGIPVQFHNCGRCEDFIDDMIDIGVKIWDPAQPTNDLDAIKKKYGRKFAIAGAYHWELPDTWPEVDEEAIRQSVRDCIDRYAPGGGFAFGGAALGKHGDKTIEKVNNWIMEEAYYYGRDYYLK